ncbi:lytic murein transglycosylase [Nocardioides sp. NPDC047086]|uniref:lytic murein transglycosylase n=1 Tax=Nocardioides sp. NPDC047086 TaxID=3154810 RepID=UPI0033EB92AC
MSKAPRKFWARSISTAALTSIGPRAVAAVALTAAFAVAAPNEGNLDTGHQQPELPDPGALQDPLGISGGLGGVKNLTPTDAVRLASNAEELSIPPVALAAYQRSATVLNDADASCRIDWALVAAIGMVESNHGRFGGSELNSNGLALPAIIGPQLNGAGNYAAIRDTDNGLYDHDTVYDHAVGPMQFIPSTWTVVGADGDGDNRRDPQDVDDAAVATAAYLCAGTEDVSTEAGASSAVYRYNQSDTYVEAVLKIAGQYRNGEFPGSPSVDGGSTSSMRPTASPLPVTSNTVKPTAKPTTKSTIKAAPVPKPPAPSKSPSPTDNNTGETDSGDNSSGGETETPTTPTPTPTPTPTDRPTTEEPEPTDEATNETLAEPCKTATTAVYPDLQAMEPETYDAVVADCIVEFAKGTTMPEDLAIRDYLRTLPESGKFPASVANPTPEPTAPEEGAEEAPTDTPSA